MKKSWGLTKRILDGRKTIESRWYSVRSRPWGRIKRGDTVYFKDSGSPVRVRAQVQKVMQFQGLAPTRVKRILKAYGARDGIERKEMPGFFKRFKDKKYCVLIFLTRAVPIPPFNIDKTGFGALAAWLTVPDISRIKQ